MFGTDDVIYVPEGKSLVFDDVYHWKRYKLDVRRYGIRMRPDAFEEVSGRMRAALEIVKVSPRFTEHAAQISQNTEEMIRDFARITGQATGRLPESLRDVIRGGSADWWLRISDLPAESFFEEDYERDAHSEASSAPHFTYGLVHIAQLDGLDVELAGEGQDIEGFPFAIDVPEQGLTRWTIPPSEPLSLIHEFCGAHGASSRGNTVNIDTHGNVAESHQFCTPIGRVGSKAFATLYFHHSTPGAEKVVGRIADDMLFPTAEMLEKSKFQLTKEGPVFRIYEREGDVVHLYSQLAGKETEGVETMPPIMLVASAAGQHDPMHRAELFDAIMQTVGK
jgi:hypothetical protein